MADKQTSAWILEFVLRQPIEDWLANELFFAMPLSPPLPSSLSRTILLRRLASDLSRRSISTRTLHSLELIHHLFHSPTSNSNSRSLSRAYAAAAFHLAVVPLRSPHSDLSPFVSSVDRIFRRRVSDLIASKDCDGLVSDELVKVKRDVEAAADGDSIARVRILTRDSEKEAIEAVRSYINEAAEAMGPSFLELVAEAVGTDAVVMEAYVSEAADKMGSSFIELAAGAVGENAFTGPHKDKREEEGRINELIIKLSTESDKHGKDQQGGGLDFLKGQKFDPLPTPVVSRAKEALKASCNDLHKVVEDPLPDAVKLAAGVLTSWTKDSAKEPKESHNPRNLHIPASSPQKNGEIASAEDRSNIVLLERNPDAPPSSSNVTVDQNDPKEKRATACDGHASAIDRDVETNPPEGNANVVVQQKKVRISIPRPSLMNRNPSAHTIEWEDSIDSPSGSSPTTPNKVRLPSPKRRKVSPLNIDLNKKFVRRRKTKRWSSLEEDTLREAVKKHGKGNWKTILSSYPDVFEERTEVDLKDKWRNMTRG